MRFPNNLTNIFNLFFLKTPDPETQVACHTNLPHELCVLRSGLWKCAKKRLRTIRSPKPKNINKMNTKNYCIISTRSL